MGRGSLWRLQTSERLAALGAACGAAAGGGNDALPPLLRVQLRAAAARLEHEARALAAPTTAPATDSVEQALAELAHIVNRYVFNQPLQKKEKVLKSVFFYVCYVRFLSFINRFEVALQLYDVIIMITYLFFFR